MKEKLTPKEIEKLKQKNVINKFRHSKIDTSLKPFNVQRAFMKDVSDAAAKLIFLYMMNSVDHPLFPSTYCPELKWYYENGKINKDKFYEVIDELVIAGYIKEYKKKGLQYNEYEIADYPRFKMENEAIAKEL